LEVDFNGVLMESPISFFLSFLYFFESGYESTGAITKVDIASFTVDVNIPAGTTGYQPPGAALLGIGRLVL
jgi:hypothetical protein